MGSVETVWSARASGAGREYRCEANYKRPNEPNEAMELVRSYVGGSPRNRRMRSIWSAIPEFAAAE
jgi:hypothetical protein